MEPTDLELRVATATVVVAAADDPYRVLVGESHKHPYPVLPGGKIDLIDVPPDCEDLEMAARNCIVRELREETQIRIDPQTLILLGIAEDPQRDIRRVTARRVSQAVTSPSFESFAVPDQDQDRTYVLAHYGCPDYLFVARASHDVCGDSEELFHLRFFDIRTLDNSPLSTGHDVVVRWYRRLLETGERPSPEALQDFDIQSPW